MSTTLLVVHVMSAIRAAAGILGRQFARHQAERQEALADYLLLAHRWENAALIAVLVLMIAKPF